jgi:hypothetical protein
MWKNKYNIFIIGSIFSLCLSNITCALSFNLNSSLINTFDRYSLNISPIHKVQANERLIAIDNFGSLQLFSTVTISSGVNASRSLYL